MSERIVGYVPGAWDMFHIGHLNVLRRAKENCDFLIAGVVTDISPDKVVMWQQLQFDVIFKGDDWKGTPKGDRLETGLGAVGVRVIYFPYTTHTSSTLLRQYISGS